MTRDQHEPVQALIPFAGNEFDTLTGPHTKAADEPNPVIEYRSSDHFISRSNVNALPPTRCEPIKGTVFPVGIPAEVALKILDADMDQHVHPLQFGELLKRAEGEIPEIKRIEEGEMQSVGIEVLCDLSGRLACRTYKATRSHTAGREPGTCSLYQ
ncbi:MAG: hypothetical protein WB678_20185 [Stellaceae bacterium]